MSTEVNIVWLCKIFFNLNIKHCSTNIILIHMKKIKTYTEPIYLSIRPFLQTLFLTFGCPYTHKWNQPTSQTKTKITQFSLHNSSSWRYRSPGCCGKLDDLHWKEHRLRHQGERGQLPCRGCVWGHTRGPDSPGGAGSWGAAASRIPRRARRAEREKDMMSRWESHE